MPIPDLTNQYNTPLSPEQEELFHDWALKGGKDPRQETYDYDLRGYYALTDGAPLGSGHLTDQFKKPNHPTFSEESIYHGKDGNYGGHWDDNKTFTPGDTSPWDKSGLEAYFSKYEDEYTITPNPMITPQ